MADVPVPDTTAEEEFDLFGHVASQLPSESCHHSLCLWAGSSLLCLCPLGHHHAHPSAQLQELLSRSESVRSSTRSGSCSCASDSTAFRHSSDDKFAYKCSCASCAES
eukprot:s11397_g1.t1